MNYHPHELLSAFALGVLDADEVRLIQAHLDDCIDCRNDADSWLAMIALLPYSVEAHQPPASVKRRLFAMLDVSDRPIEYAPPPREVKQSRWSNWIMTSALVITLLCMGFGFSMYRMQTELDRRNRQMLFMSNAESYHFEAKLPLADATFYMQPGQTYAMLIVRELNPLPPGQAYQLWLSKANARLPVMMLKDEDGQMMVDFEAPAPLNTYDAIMLTVEPETGSTEPSSQTVLEADLTAVRTP